MEVYIERKKKDDGIVTQYIRDVVALNAYGNNEVRVLHVIDSADEGCVVFDVIKFEVY